MDKKRVEFRYKAGNKTGASASQQRRAPIKESEQRQRYKRAIEAGGAAKKTMTYDEYIASTTGDPMFDIEDTHWKEELKEIFADHIEVGKKVSSKVSPGLKKVGGAAKESALKAKSKATRINLSNKQYALLFSSLALLVLSGYIFTSQGSTVIVPQSGEVESAVTGGNPITQEFTPVLPDNLQEERGLKIDPTFGVATFRDFVQGNTVTISQQPLTDEQKLDPEGALEIVAVSLFAGVALETNKGTLYLTTPTGEDSSQVAIFSTQDLLVFMRSQGVVINNDAWIRYVDSL